jgi:hypothetical protein
MPAGIADLLHDAAVLHRFVDFIEEYCKEQERSQIYADASGLFFQYVEKLAAGIKQELGKEIDRATRFPQRLPLLRSNVLTLKNYLRLLHALIKPAADAHTLTTPAPLIDLASRQLQLVERMSNSRIVILLTSEFMYFQRSHTDIKDQARIVESFIPRASFPLKLGFIELPYSQGASFFTNLAIYHEIGHFAYEELSNSDPPHPEMAALKASIVRALNKAFRRGSHDPEAFALAVRILENWIQEIFCDLFAIRLVGPAFSFAFIEMLGMLGFLTESTTVKFNPTHPAAACRLAEHVKMLEDDLWWKAIANVEATQKKILERLAKLPRSRYRFYFDERRAGSQRLVDVFLDFVIPAIRKLVRKVTPDSKDAVTRFERSRSSIEACLRVGVVPHMPSNAGVPDPVSVINSAFCFYLTSLPEIVQRFEGVERANDVAVHSLWTKRLEMWTMKAIEDSQIQAQFRRVKRTVRWSFQEKKS